MATFYVYTISSGSVTEGAQVGKLTVKGAGVDIPAILVGEEGRGRDRGALPVQLTPSQEAEWKEKGTVTIRYAEVGQTRAGKPKLFSKDAPTSDEKVLCIFYTKIGFRGGNNHTGDKSFEPCPCRGKPVSASYSCDKCGMKRPVEIEGDCFVQWTHPDSGDVPVFAAFPSEKLVSGTIAQGDAGRMGCGEQMAAALPKDTVFRTAYSGRLYGAPSAHYYKWDGSKLLCATWDERVATDLF